MFHLPLSTRGSILFSMLEWWGPEVVVPDPVRPLPWVVPEPEWPCSKGEQWLAMGLEMFAGDEKHIPLLPWSVVLLSPATAALTLLMIPDMMVLWNYENWEIYCVCGIKKAFLELDWSDWGGVCRVRRKRRTVLGYLWYWHSIIQNEVKHTKPGKKWRDTGLTSFTIWQDPTTFCRLLFQMMHNYSTHLQWSHCG